VSLAGKEVEEQFAYISATFHCQLR
jgi:hypothetical protein